MSETSNVAREISHGAEFGGFFGSLMGGFLLGFGLDAWLGTKPAFIVVGIIVGAATGFWKMWQYAKAHDGS